jgi:7-keto-8-aminopelargonate synthetase-like enzyme
MMLINKNWVKKRVLNANDKLSKVYASCENICNAVVDKTVFLNNGNKYIEFVSCSYLGLHNDVRIINAICDREKINNYGFLFSSARTRMIFNEEFHITSKLAEIFKPYNPILFQNVHMVHLGVLPLIASGCFPGIEYINEVEFLIDRHAHQSMKCLIGLLGQFGNVEYCDAHCLSSLEESLKITVNKKKMPILLTDSLGSMGQVYNILEINKLINKYKGYAYFDDAHGMSIFGRNGAGYVLNKMLHQSDNRIFIATGLTKGFGAHGGCILLPSKDQVSFVKQYATTYTFSGPISIPNLLAIEECANIHLSGEIYKLQNKLRNNITYFDNHFMHKTYNVFAGSDLPIRTLLIGSETDAIELFKYLKEKKILTTCAVYPTVEKNNAIIRVCFSAKHTKEEILLLIECLDDIIGKECATATKITSTLVS